MRQQAHLTRVEKYLILNLYGNLPALAALFCLALGFTFPVSPGGRTAAVAAAGVSAILLLWWAARITRRLSSKARIANVIIARIERHGYDPVFFKNTCGDACMRLMTWWIHRRVGQPHQYASVVSQHRGEGVFFVEHSNPEVEALLNSGALKEQDVRDAIREYLTNRSR